MADLIDRAAADVALVRLAESLLPGWKEQSRGVRHARALILDAPTIDAAPVVRCCDCFFASPNIKQSDYLDPPSCDGMYCFRVSQDVDFMDFCSQGRKRTDMDADAPER